MSEIPKYIENNDTLKQDLLSISDLNSIPTTIGENIVKKSQIKLDGLNNETFEKIDDNSSNTSFNVSLTFGSKEYSTNDKVSVNEITHEGNMDEVGYVTSSQVNKLSSINESLREENSGLYREYYNTYNDEYGEHNINDSNYRSSDNANYTNYTNNLSPLQEELDIKNSQAKEEFNNRINDANIKYQNGQYNSYEEYIQDINNINNFYYNSINYIIDSNDGSSLNNDDYNDITNLRNDRNQNYDDAYNLYNEKNYNLSREYNNEYNSAYSSYQDELSINRAEFEERGEPFREQYEARREVIRQNYIDTQLEIDKKYDKLRSEIDIELDENYENIYENSDIIDNHVNRHLGKMETSILDAMFDPHNDGKTVIQILGDKYRSGTEKEKIELAQVLTSYMNTNYDHELLNTGIGENGKTTVSTQEMFDIYKEGGNAGVCRHIARAGAQLLDELGFNAGVVSVQNSGSHAITWGKKEDSSYFLVDYGTLYEAKSPKELLSRYGASHNKVDLKNYISDENGEYTGFITTLEGEQMQLNTSSFDTTDIFKYTGNLNKEGIDIVNGHDFDLDFTNNGGKKISYRYGNGNFEIGGDYSQNKNIGQYVDSMDTVGVFVGAKVGDMYGDLGELGFKAKISQTDIKFDNGLNTYQNISANIDWVKNIYNSNNTKVNIASTLYGNIGIIKDSDDINARGIDNFLGGFGTSLLIDHNFNDKLSGDLSLNAGGDFITNNMVDSTEDIDSVTFSKKYGVGGNLEYKTDSGDEFLVGGNYEKGLGYKKYSGKLGIKSGNLGVSGYYEVDDNRGSGFGVEEKNYGVNLSYDITEHLKLTGQANKTDDGFTQNSYVGAGIEYKF